MATILMGGLIEVYRGRDTDLEFTLEDNSDPPVAIDLTGATGWRLLAKVDVADGDAKALVDKTGAAIVVTDAVNGKVKVSLAAADTTDRVALVEGEAYQVELYYVDSGSKKRSGFVGRIRALETVVKGS